MPVRINNLESNITTTNSKSSGTISESDIEMIVRIVLERIRDEQARVQRIDEETKITNKVSKKDIFD